jgi:hypothetical protein
VGHLKGVASLTLKHWTRLERLAVDKHSSLFGPFVSTEEKGLIALAPSQFEVCVAGKSLAKNFPNLPPEKFEVHVDVAADDETTNFGLDIFLV